MVFRVSTRTWRNYPWFGIAAGTGIWIVGISIGMWQLVAYSTTPGPTTEVRAVWPQQSTLQLETESHTLLVFMHPRCPCSRATLNSMARVLASAEVEVVPKFIFGCPSTESATWAQTDLWTFAEGLGQPILDWDSAESQLFGAVTSGHVMLFAPTGELVFSGGVTIGRGHEGDAIGKCALSEALRGKNAANDRFQIYGCPIMSTQELRLVP